MNFELNTSATFKTNAFSGRFEFIDLDLRIILNFFHQPSLFSGKSKGSETGELKNYLTQVL